MISEVIFKPFELKCSPKDWFLRSEIAINELNQIPKLVKMLTPKSRFPTSYINVTHTKSSKQISFVE